MNNKRVRLISNGSEKEGPVVYWISRDQRMSDNWALLYAQEKALEKEESLIIVFSLSSSFLKSGFRQYSFMIEGLRELEENLHKKNIPFHLLFGSPEETIPIFIKKNNASSLITDFSPLRVKKKWLDKIVYSAEIPVFEIDAHNIVPCWIASEKQEWAARTFRPKVNRLLPEFLDDFSSVKKMGSKKLAENDWKKINNFLNVDKSVEKIDWLKPGEEEAIKVLKSFVKNKLSGYEEESNNPNLNIQSNLSPYLHFGQISAQRIAIRVKKSGAGNKNKDAFLEELIVRKELSDNYCFYNKNYDNFKGLPEWSKKTLNKHREDKREYSYSLKDFENAETHDDLWNAAQREMVNKGKMHGYMRMYWAKKILEWTKRPEEAIRITIHLNNKYELDGRDPNGYVGVLWSIGGLHDRAWKERKIFGKVRYMSYDGCKRKFNINKYIKKNK